MAQRNDIVHFLDDYFAVDRIRDASINGLQVIGTEQVSKIALGVSASLELFQRAADAQADMLIVHHGLFWTNSERVVLDVMKARLKALFDSNANLLAYHLPLDAHPEIGNNAQLLQRLSLIPEEQVFGFFNGTAIGVIGKTSNAVPVDQFSKEVANRLGVEAITLPLGPNVVNRVGIISGGASSSLLEARDAGCDLFLTGEVRESTPALAREAGINCIAIGHYNSEKYGLLALGDLLQQRFATTVEFIDLPNPF